MIDGRDISSIMRRVHSRNTTPELDFRKALRQAGIAYRLQTDHLPGKPDLTITKAKLAVFVDGDYWHGGQWVRRGLTCLEEQFLKTSNSGYWLKKIRSNMRRDAEVTAQLMDLGWKVIRFWESSIKSDLSECLRKVKGVIDGEINKVFAVSMIPRKTVAEFFAGIGLVRLGLESGGWRVVYANDIDSKKRQMYSDHFADTDEKFELKDINDVKSADIPEITLVTASFPCNDTSLAGGRKGLSGEKSSTFWGLIRILKDMEARRPPLVMIENVTGFFTSNGGKDFESALTALNDLGYLTDTFQIDAANFVPQSRKRLFVIGTLRGIIPVDFDNRDSRCVESDLRPKKLVDFINNSNDIEWLIRDLPCLPKNRIALKDFLEDIPDDSPVWWSSSRCAYLLGQMTREHRSKAQLMIDAPEYGYGTIFRRVRKGVTRAELRNDGMAGCLRTPKGGSARQILFRGGKGDYKVRLLTALECSRLMGVSNFRINVPESQALYGFGDAVVVPVINWISTYYLDPLVNRLLRAHTFG